MKNETYYKLMAMRDIKYKQAADEHLGMKWYIFTIYVRIFLGIILDISDSIAIISDDIFSSIYTVFVFIWCIVRLYARHLLTYFMRKGIMLYFISMYALPILFLIPITLINFYTNELDVTKELVENIVGLIIFFIPEIIYYKKRFHLFEIDSAKKYKRKRTWHKDYAKEENIASEQVTLDDVLSVEPPYLDYNALAFADEDEIKQTQKQCAEDMYEFIKNKTVSEKNSNIKFKFYKTPLLIIVALITVTVTGIMCYNRGFKDNQPFANDGTPIVYITSNGSKYHKKTCDYINNLAISISTQQALERGYSACSVCNPSRINSKSIVLRTVERELTPNTEQSTPNDWKDSARKILERRKQTNEFSK